MSIAAIAVDERVVHLRQHRVAPAREALDERDLPQRPRAVQPARHLGADELGELRVAAGRRQPRHAHVPADVEVVVVDPDRVGDPRRGVLQALAVARNEVQPRADALDQPLVADPGRSNTSTPPTAMLTGPCSAASEDRSAGERSSAIASTLSGKDDRVRGVVDEHVAVHVRVRPARVRMLLHRRRWAADASVTFQCCQYTPNSVRILPSEKVTWHRRCRCDVRATSRCVSTI